MDSSLCLDCHKAVKERFADRGGYHGKLEGKCETCHTDHKGLGMDIISLNSETFNHRLANYPLTGKHAEIDCNKCHPEKGPEDEIKSRYIGLNFGECTACHKDPHPDGFGLDCMKCHTTAGWSGRALSYVHNLDSKYKLLGKHQEISCAKCHKSADPEATFSLPNTQCAQCHQDVHKGQLSKHCENCHNEQGWTGRNLAYSHAQDSKYKLLGKHQALDCNKCHRAAEPGAKLAAAQFANLGTECLHCHEDEHKEQLSKKCSECHNELGWKGALVSFDHNEQSSYRLDAIHQSAACADCHQDKKYKPLESECTGCHGAYDSIMAGGRGQAPGSAKSDPHWNRVRCDQCHDTRIEDQRMALYQDKCVECHNPRYGPLLLDWMKEWSRLRAEVQALFQQAAEEKALPANRLEWISRRLVETEKIGAQIGRASCRERV